MDNLFRRALVGERKDLSTDEVIAKVIYFIYSRGEFEMHDLRRIINHAHVHTAPKRIVLWELFAICAALVALLVVLVCY